MSNTQISTAAPGAADAAKTYPKTLFQPAPGVPGFKSVMVTDQASEKTLHPPGFATRAEAAAYNAPLEQPIPHITRTNNEDQFDDRKSQMGHDIPSGVVRTEAPVQSVFVKTGIDPTTLAVTAQLPDGIDPQAITAHSSPGAVYAPPPGGPPAPKAA